MANRKKSTTRKPNDERASTSKKRGSTSDRRKMLTRGDTDCSTEDQSRDCYKSSTNDYRWYVNNEQLLKDTASFPYGYAAGTPINLGELAAKINQNTIPGIMKVKYVPTIGWSASNVSPINVAARKMYAIIRQANSGAKNYDSPDLILYILAMDSAISYLAYMKRIYGVLSLTSYVNRYYPRAIIESMKLNYDDIIAHYDQLRAYINMYAQRLSALPIPANIAYNAKHMWMCSGIYTDSPNGKSQIYYFEPEGFHIFTHDEDGAGKLEFTYQFNEPSFGSYAGFDDITSFGNKILNPILYGYGEEDFNLIGGDILKAYGSNVYRAEGIAEGYTVVPVYDPTVLSQIENATMFGLGIDTWDGTGLKYPVLSNYDITQSADKSYLVAKPLRAYEPFRKPLEPAGMDRIVNIHHDNPTPADTIEATRFLNIPTIITAPENGDPHLLYQYSSGGKHVYMSCDVLEYRQVGSELTTRAFIYWYTMPDKYGQMKLSESTEIQSNITLSTKVLESGDSTPGKFKISIGEYTVPDDEPTNNSDITAVVRNLLDDIVTTTAAGNNSGDYFFDFSADQATTKAYTAMKQASDQISTAALLSNFDWHPFVTYYGDIEFDLLFNVDGSAGVTIPVALKDNEFGSAPSGFLGDVDNYTVVNASSMDQMNQVALLSLFGV